MWAIAGSVSPCRSRQGRSHRYGMRPAEVVAMRVVGGSTSVAQLTGRPPVEAAGIGVAAQQRDGLLIGHAQHLRPRHGRGASRRRAAPRATAPVTQPSRWRRGRARARRGEALADDGGGDDDGGIEHRRHRREKAPLHEVAAQPHDVERHRGAGEQGRPEEAPRHPAWRAAPRRSAPGAANGCRVRRARAYWRR